MNELQKRLQIHGLKRRIFGIFFDFFSILICIWEMHFDLVLKFDLDLIFFFFFGIWFWFSTQHEGIEPQQQSRTVHN